MRRRTQPAHAAVAALLTVALAGGCGGPTPPDSVPEGFVLHPGFEMALAAAEPVVVDPVDLAFDEHGRAYVLELPGYPDMGRPARIVSLLDRDRDGRWETRRPFADDLGMADAILPWREGLLVAAPPDLVYLEDTDGDGRADRREVMLSGFAAGNPQHNVNGLRHGLDNWIHGVNGGNGGRLFWPDAPEEAVELGRDDFRIRFGGAGAPGSAGVPGGSRRPRRFERTGPGADGFGMTFGPWGRSFVTHNLEHLSQLVVPRRYLEGLPAARQNGRQRLAPHPDGGPAELFPIGERQTRPNHPEQSSRFSAACAVTIYDGGVLDAGFEIRVATGPVPGPSAPHELGEEAGEVVPERGSSKQQGEVDGDTSTSERATGGRTTGLHAQPAGRHDGRFAVFVADPSANVVHRAMVDARGVVAEAARGRPGVEFLASTNPHFRPVNLHVGPDGELYVLDMHRAVIEHPEWIPDRIEEALDLREGDERGRIYRIVPAGGLPGDRAPFAGFDRSRTEALVDALGDENRWRRTTAQRLLVEEHGSAPPPALQRMLRGRLASGEPVERLHALWTLSGLGVLEPADLAAAMRDPHPELRRNAVLAFEEGKASSGGDADLAPLRQTLVQLIDDPAPVVRFQAVLTAGVLLRRDVIRDPEFERKAAAAVVAGLLARESRSGGAAGEAEAGLTATPSAPAAPDARWTRLAAVTVLAEDPVSSVVLQLESGAAEGRDGSAVAEELAGLVPADLLGEALSHPTVLRFLDGDGGQAVESRRALMAGLAAAFGGRERRALETTGLNEAALEASLGPARRSGDDRLAIAAWRLASALGLEAGADDLALLDCAGVRAGDATRTVEERLGALDLFALWPPWQTGGRNPGGADVARRVVECPGAGVEAAALSDDRTWLERIGELLLARHPDEVQAAAMETLARADESEVAAFLIDRWARLGPTAKRDAGAWLIRGRGRHAVLLDALEDGRIGIGEMNFDLERRRFLLRSPEPDVRRRAAALFDDAGVVSRPDALQAMRPALDLPGDPTRGRDRFLELCARCHRFGEHGGGPGPDLGGIGRRSAETLLHDILDPNAAVDTAFVNYILETVNGEVFAGLLAERLAGGGVVLKGPDDTVFEVPADRIRSLRSDGLSMMPEELEAGLEPAGMADLLAFLRG